jgi:hypothetical protein
MSSGRDRLTRTRALVLAGLLAAVALIAAGCASAIDGTGTFAGGATSTTTSSSATGTRTQDFPDRTTSSSRSTSSSTSSSTSTGSSSTRTSTSAAPSPDSTDAALKRELADKGVLWVHAYANGDVATFCELADRPSLQSVLDEKGITSCDTLTISWDDDPDLQAQLAAFAIPDPSDILLLGSTAFILSFDTQPEGLSLGLSWIQQADGTWLVDASVLTG